MMASDFRTCFALTLTLPQIAGRLLAFSSA
jgi:hypothetical protein